MRDCPNEVRSLVAEVNVLCGVLDRLRVLLQPDTSQRSVGVGIEDNEDKEDDASEGSSDSDDGEKIVDAASKSSDSSSFPMSHKLSARLESPKLHF